MSPSATSATASNPSGWWTRGKIKAKVSGDLVRRNVRSRGRRVRPAEGRQTGARSGRPARAWCTKCWLLTGHWSCGAFLRVIFSTPNTLSRYVPQHLDLLIAGTFSWGQRANIGYWELKNPAHFEAWKNCQMSMKAREIFSYIKTSSAVGSYSCTIPSSCHSPGGLCAMNLCMVSNLSSTAQNLQGQQQQHQPRTWKGHCDFRGGGQSKQFNRWRCVSP